MDILLITKLISSILLVAILILIIRYLWISITDRNYEPVSWIHLKKNKLISKEIIELLRASDDKARFINFWLQVNRLKKEKVSGDFAELGVYKGDSAKILHLLDQTRDFHLFDTFGGIPEKDLKNETGEAATYSNKNFRDTSIEKVKANIGESSKIHFYKGYFPETAIKLKDKKFALVNMDVNFYNSTFAGLDFFYQRLSPGGVIIIHDYNYKWPGLMKAVDEFVRRIPENLIEVPDVEGSVMIIRNKTIQDN